MKNDISRRDFFKKTGLISAATLFDPKTLKALEPLRPQKTGRVAGRSVKTIDSICEMCFWRCLISGKVDKGRLVKIDGNPNSPSNKGKVCARGNAGVKLLYDPDRLKYPLKRVGPRGSGRWVKISWDQALDEIAQNFLRIRDTYGTQSLALFPHGSSAQFIHSFFHSLGSKSISEASYYQCRGNRDIGYKMTFGESPGSPERIDLAHADAMLFIGSHLGENLHLSQTMEWIEGLQRGAKLVVVDPRFSVAASKADIWLQIKPGTDVALLLAWTRYIIDKNLYDSEFVEKNCIGFDQLKQHIEHATIDWAAGITDLEPEKIVEAIELLTSQMPRVAIHPGRHSTWYGINDTQRTRSMAILTALLGAFGKKGGLFLKTKIGMKMCKSRLHEKPVLQPPHLLRDKWPINLPGTPTADVIDATFEDEPYPIKAWMVWGQNIMQSTPSPERTLHAIKNLEYLVVVDLLPSPATAYADIILPEATYLERYDLIIKNQHSLTPYVAYRKPMVDPLYESKDPYWITKKLAEKMGYPQAFPWNDITEVIDTSLKSIGLSRNQIDRNGGVINIPGEPYLKEDEEYHFKTRSGKIELYSNRLERLGLDPVPEYKPPQPGKTGYYRLLYGRTPVHTMSRTQNNAWLHHEAPENCLWIHPEVAKKLNIEEGQQVRLENQGRVKSGTTLKAKITIGIRQDCVYMEAMYGSPSELLKNAFKSGVSDGSLMTDRSKDPLVGTVGLRNNFVQIQPV
ncbi:MAG: molybdopterin-dependent oxidoreductase [Proteobacteria bacterium]|nr:molybdopterin-dependent oxidoreductase [Pseudomonadota bacterium]